MAKRRVTDIVTEGNGFCKVFVESQGARHGSSELHHFHCVRQSSTIMIANVGLKNLPLVLESPKRA